MSKNFEFKKGYVGVVSDKVAEILTKKGEGKVVPGTPEPPKTPDKDAAKK